MDSSSSGDEDYDDSQNLFTIDELCSSTGNPKNKIILPTDTVSDEVLIEAAESVVHDCELLGLLQSPPHINGRQVSSNEKHQVGQHLPVLHEVTINNEQNQTSEYNAETHQLVTTAEIHQVEEVHHCVVHTNLNNDITIDSQQTDIDNTLSDFHEVSTISEQNELLQHSDVDEIQVFRVENQQTEQNSPDLHEVSTNSEQNETLQGSCVDGIQVRVENQQTEQNFSELDTENSKRLKKKEGKGSKRNDARLLRMRGCNYVGFRRKEKGKTNKVLQDVKRAERTMGDRCESSKCQKSKLRHCSSITDEMRLQLFNMFWKKLDWEAKKTYVFSVVKIKTTHQKTKKEGTSRRKNSFFYFLKFNESEFAVCKKMFLSTLAVTENEVRYWIDSFCPRSPSSLNSSHNNSSSGNISEDSINNSIPEVNHSISVQVEGHIHGQSRRARKHKNMFLKSFFDSLPKLPSHYCRKSSNKMYLQTDIRSVAQLYDVYISNCKDSNEEPLSRAQFDLTYKEMKIGVFTPRKDQCDTCCSYEEGNIDKDLYTTHIQLKDTARKEKESDKISAEKGDCYTICCDVMAVQPIPLLKASSAYFKLKLSVHNFTVYNLATHDVMAYWFDESEAGLNASVFASCLIDYLEKLLDVSEKPIIIYSDGCTAQNRNAVLSNALLHLSMSRNVSIQQKYLEKGHTQMECDSAHSVIERRYKDLNVHLPSQFVQYTQMARKAPPYGSKLLDHSFFKDYSTEPTMVYSSIRPGKVSGDPVVTDIRVLLYSPEGNIKYKLKFSDEFAELPQRPKKISPIAKFPQMYEKRLEIPLDKWQDLQLLKPMIPPDCHGFFDMLPHGTSSKRKERNTEKTKTEQNKKIKLSVKN